jgi:hypothetical protein
MATGDVDTLEELEASIDAENNGQYARAVWEYRAQFGRDRAFYTLMRVWDWEQHALYEAFGRSVDALVSAIREVAPPIERNPLRVWRGISIRAGWDPADAAIGLSWTTDYDVACWFATDALGFARRPGFRPFVLEMVASPDAILTIHQNRPRESEVLLDPSRLDRVAAEIMVEGTNISVADLKPDRQVPADAVARWREAGACYDQLIRGRSFA